MYSKIVSNLVYSKDDVAESRQAFLTYLKVQVRPLGFNRIQLQLEAKQEFWENRREIYLEFLNFMLDTATQRMIRNS